LTDRPGAGGLIVGLVLPLAILAAPVRAETLAEAIALAYDSNPTLQGQRAQLRALDETYVQAEAGYRPTATLQATVTTDSNNFTGTQTGVPGSNQPVLQAQSQTSGAAISVTQPVFTGGRVAAQVSAAEANILAGRETLRGTEQTVLRYVVNAYADVRRDQRIVEVLQNDVALLFAQLKESRDRFTVGDITKTDVAQTEARVAASQAQLANARAQLSNSRAEYDSVVGKMPENLAPEPPLTKHLPASLDMAFEWAELNSPQIGQADFTEQGSAAKLAEAKAQTRPTLSLQGTAGYSGGSFATPFNLGGPSVGGLGSPFMHYSHDLTASAVVTFPIFTGGTTSSQIRQAAESNNADRIGIETARRQVLLNVSQAWNALIGSRAQVEADEVQVKAANLAFEGSRQESRVGLRSTLDVLISEENFSAAELALVNANHDEYVAAADLLAASGAIYARDFDAQPDSYDPKTNFNHATHAWPWSPWAPAVADLDKVGAPRIQPRPQPVSPNP